MGDQDQPQGQDQSQTGGALAPPPAAASDITVTGAPRRGPSAGDIVRVGGSILTNPTGVGGQVIRNERLIEGGDDYNHIRPTIGPALRLAEAIGDGVNDRNPSGLAARFNQISGFSMAGIPVADITPLGGAVSVITDFTGSRESGGNRISEFGTNLLSKVPGVGVLAGVLRGGQDVEEVRRGVRLLSDNNIPGFRYDETMIDGHRVRIYVSAADTLADVNANPWVNIQTKGIDKDDPRVQARAQAVLGQATEDLYNFTTTVNDQDIANGGDGVSGQDVQTALYGRMRETLARTGAIPADVENGRVGTNNGLVRAAEAGANIIAP